MLHRFFVTILSFTIFGFVLSAEAFQVIRSGMYEGLADSDGETLIPAVYESIGWSNDNKEVLGELIGYREENGWGLISVKNKKITDPKFTILEPFGSHSIKAAIKGNFSNQLFYGLMDLKGDVYVDFKYFSVEELSSDLLKVSNYRDRTVYYGAVGKTGQSIVPISFNSVDTLGNMLLTTLGSKKKLFNKSGSPVLDFWLDDVLSTPNGILVSKEGRYGLVSENGEVVYQVKYKSIDGNGASNFQIWKIGSFAGEDEVEVKCDSLIRNHNGTWTAYLNKKQHLLTPEAMQLSGFNEYKLVDNQNGCLLMQNQSDLKWAVFDKKGNELVSGKDSVAIDSAYFYVSEKGKWNVYNYFGRMLSERPFDELLGAQERMLGARKYNYWGWLNFTGGTQIEFKYDAIDFGLTDDQFVAQYVGKWGVSDFNDHYVILPEYDRLECHGKFYVAYKGATKRIYNTAGKHVYVTTSQVSGSSVLRLEHEGKVGAIFSEENIFYPVYDSIVQIGEYFVLYSDGYASVQSADGEQVFGFGEAIQEVYGFAEDFFLIKKDGRFGLVDNQGRLLIANRYDGAQCFSEGMAAVKLIGKWGYVDKMESLKVQPFYDEVTPFKNGRAVVRIGDTYGVIDASGREVLSMEWKMIARQSTGNYVLKDAYGRYGLADVNADMILSPIFEKVMDAGDGKIIAQKAGSKGVITYEGYTKIPFKYDRIEVVEGQLLLLEEQLY